MKFVWPAILLMLLSFLPREKRKNIFLAGDSTMSIKETRAYPETGWGMPFVHFWDSTVTVVNMARNGRSTRTFISEGIWRDLIAKVSENDIVLIQFGHNDESKEKTERYTSPADYRTNLLRFVNESRAKKAIPVLITPVGRRRFDSTGNVVESHAIYSDVVRELAKSAAVPMIDLDRRSQALYQQLGKDDSRLLFLQLKKGEHPNYPEGKEDNTHFNELGARLVAQIVLEDLRRLLPQLEDSIIKPKSK